MKRMAYIFLAEIVLAGMLVTLAGAQTEPWATMPAAIRKDEKTESARSTTTTTCLPTDKISIVGTARNDSRGRQSRLHL